MKIISGRADGAFSEQRTDTFTGTAWLDRVLPESDGTVVNNVFFAPGARTNWHQHERGQLLVVTAGRGRVCSEGGEPVEIGAGDIVWVPPGERHWHGGTDKTYLVHFAVSLGSTDWAQPVTDSEFGVVLS